MPQAPERHAAAAAIVSTLVGSAHGRARTAAALRLRGPDAFRELLLLTLCTVLPALGALALLG
jgi:hypothetical protein